MTRALMQRTQIVSVSKEVCKVLSVDRSTQKYVLQAVVSDQVYTITFEEAVELYRVDSLDLDPTSERPHRDRLQEVLRYDISQFSEVAQEKARRRHAYVEAALAEELEKGKDYDLKKVIVRVAETLVPPDVKPPEPRTLKLWISMFEASRGSIVALAPRYDKRGNHSKRLYQADGTGRIELDAEQAFQLFERLVPSYLRSERPSGAAFFKYLETEFRQENARREPARQLPVPSRATVYRWLGKIPQYEIILNRYGKKKARELFKIKQRNVDPDFILSVVEIDATKLGVIVVNLELGIVLGRPIITAAVDRKSRIIVGFYIGFEPTGDVSALRCLKHMIAPKPGYAAMYGDPQLEWPWYGLPQQIFVDNAGEWRGKSIENARLQLGLNIEYQPAQRPEWKGRIERWFRTLETGCFAWMPGKTFSNVAQKGDYDAESMAVVDIDELRRIITSWIILEYNHGYHSVMHDYPSRVWREGAKQLDPTLPGKFSNLDVLDYVVIDRHLNSKGVRFRNIYYFSDELQALLYREGSCSVRFLVNPDDLSEAQVQDPANGEHIAVYPEPCLRVYTERLSLVEHYAVLAYQRDRAHEYGRSLGLEESRDKLRREMQSLCSRAGTSLKDRTKAARILRPESAEQGPIRNVLQATEGGSSIARELDAEDRKAPFSPERASSAASKKSKKSRSPKDDEGQRDLSPDPEDGASYGNEPTQQSEEDDYESFKQSKTPNNPRSLDPGQT